MWTELEEVQRHVTANSVADWFQREGAEKGGMEIERVEILGAEPPIGPPPRERVKRWQLVLMFSVVLPPTHHPPSGWRYKGSQ